MALSKKNGAVLIYPPYYSDSTLNPPLGLAYIAAVLEQNKIRARIFDLAVENFSDHQLIENIKAEEPAIIGISFMTNQIGFAYEKARLMKEHLPEIPTAMGGPHVSVLPEETLNQPYCDFVVIGEGEKTMLELAEGKPARDIKGLGYKENGRMIINERREISKDLDSIPYPAWDLLQVNKYNAGGGGMDPRKPVGALLSSRGCPYFCIYCDSHSIFGRTFRGRSAENIFGELKWLHEKYGIDQFDFVDDTMTVDHDRMMSFCGLILNNKLNITWACNARVNTITKEMLERMKQAGCVRLDFGVETGDERVKKRIKKGVSFDQIKEAFALSREVGIKTLAFVMVGNLGEDREAVDNTIELIKSLNPDYYGCSISTPFPGTQLYKEARENNWLEVMDWSRYVTAPGIIEGYHPIMRTDKMTTKEILDAYFYLTGRLSELKHRREFGTCYVLNPKWINKKISECSSMTVFLRRVYYFFKRRLSY